MTQALLVTITQTRVVYGLRNVNTRQQHHQIEQDMGSLLKLLSMNGADINGKADDDVRQSTLHCAALESTPHVVGVLLDL